MNCEGVKEAAVFGIPDEHWGESVVASIISEPGVVLDAEAIISYCREHLARYKVPKLFDFQEELPRVASGKIDKKQLKESFLQKKR